MQLTIVIPFYNGGHSIQRLLASIPKDIPVLVVDDQSTAPYQPNRNPNVAIHWMERKGYFTGAVNQGLRMSQGDVLVVNQDAYFENDSWLELIAEKRERFGIVGENIHGVHPAWPKGYVQGTFMFVRRDVVERIGLMNEADYPLWGSTCEYQLRACRAGFEALPCSKVPGFHHRRTGGVGSAIHEMLKREPDKRRQFIRTPPELSIVATYHNNGKYAHELVSSLMGGETALGHFDQQSFASFELIMVDDASSDNTPEILASLEDRTKGIRFIQRKQNGGTAAANNTGIAQAYGSYITVIGGDDMRAEGSLEMMYRAQLSNPHSFIYDDVMCFTNGKRRPDMQIGVGDYDFEKLLYRNQVHAGIMFPKAAWLEAGGYPEVFNDGREDWAINVALGRVCYCGVRLRNPGYLYRREKQNRSLTNATKADHARFLAKLQMLFPDLYKGEIPMCSGGCGGRKSITIKPSAKRRALLEIPNMENLVIVEYIGRSSGTQSFYGIATGSRYEAGLTRPRVAVDRRDLVGSMNRPGLLELRESGKPLFRIVPPPAKTAPVKAQPEVDVVKAESAQPEQAIVEMYKITLPELRKLPLEQKDAEYLLKIEQAGRNRKSIIAYLEGLAGA